MTRFQPSSYGQVASLYGDTSYGEGDDTNPGEGRKGAEVLAEWAPAISSLLFGGDPRQQYEKKKAQLGNYTRLYNSTPSTFLRGVYANKIRTLQAEIKVLGEKAGEERTAVAITQTGKIGGIVLLVAGTVTVLIIGNYFRQKTKTEKAQRKALGAK